jgi:hypothetical protein
MKSFFEEQITRYLNDPQVRSVLARPTYKLLIETNLDLMIRWHAQCDVHGRDSYGFSTAALVSTFEVSERAAQVIEDILASPVTREDKCRKLRHDLHYEHNPPVEVIKRQLVALPCPASAEAVLAVLNGNYGIVILSNEEARALDGNPRNTYPLDGSMVNGAGMSRTGSASDRLGRIKASLIGAKRKEALSNELKHLACRGLTHD